MRPIFHTLALFAFAAMLATCSTASTPPPATRSVDVSTGDIRFVPASPSAERAAVTHEIAGVLQTLYTKAFIRPKEVGRTPVPTGIDVPTTVGTMFSPGARAALQQDPSTFTLGPNVELLRGHIFWNGVVTRERSATTALVGVRFTGTASRVDEASAVLVVSQSGTMLLQRTETGWFVREFDLKLRTAAPPPTPTPT